MTETFSPATEKRFNRSEETKNRNDVHPCNLQVGRPNEGMNTATKRRVELIF